MTEATASTRAFGNGVLASSRNTQVAWTAITVGAGAVGIAMKRMFDEWHQGSAALRVGTGATGAALGELEDSMAGVAGTVTQGVGAVGQAMADLATRTGQTGEPLEHLTKSFLDLERITGEATSQTIPAVTRLFGDWSVATEDQVATMDKLYLASQNTGIGVGRLSELMVQFGSPLRQLGIDFDTAAALFAKFEQEGVNLQTLLPGLRMALKNFSIAGREPAEALRETIAEIQNAASTAEANQIAFETFGVRAGPDMAAAILEGRFEVEELIAAMNSGSDSIEAAAEDTLTLSDRLTMLKNRIVGALGPFGEIGAIVGGAVASIGPLVFGLAALTNAFHRSAGAAVTQTAAVKAATTQTFIYGRAVTSTAASTTSAGSRFSRLGGAFGLIGAAAGLAVVGIMAAREEAAQAAAAIDDLTQAVLTGTQTFDQWRADALAAAEAEGALSGAAGEAWLARLDEIEATARSRVEMDRRRQELEAGLITEEEYTVAAERHGLTEEQVAANIEAARRAQEAQNSATEEGIEPTTTYTEALEELKEEAAATKEIAELLTAALEGLAGTQLDAEKASLAWLDSLADLNAELRDGRATLDIHTQAGRDNRSAILQAIEAAVDHGAAVAEETGSVEEGARAVRSHIRALIDEAVQAGVSKEEIRGYIEELNLTPKQIRTMLHLLGVQQASNELGRFFETWNGRTINVNLGVTTPSEVGGGVGHAGGIVGALGARRLHGGGRLRGDEEMFIGQRGERVLSVAETRQYEAMRTVRPPGSANMLTSAPPTIIVNIHAGAFVHERDIGKFVAAKLVEHARQGGRHHPTG